MFLVKISTIDDYTCVYAEMYVKAFQYRCVGECHGRILIIRSTWEGKGAGMCVKWCVTVVTYIV